MTDRALAVHLPDWVRPTMFLWPALPLPGVPQRHFNMRNAVYMYGPRDMKVSVDYGLCVEPLRPTARVPGPAPHGNVPVEQAVRWLLYQWPVVDLSLIHISEPTRPY